jgi:hypothetical protein
MRAENEEINNSSIAYLSPSPISILPPGRVKQSFRMDPSEVWHFSSLWIQGLNPPGIEIIPCIQARRIYWLGLKEFWKEGKPVAIRQMGQVKNPSKMIYSSYTGQQ